MPEIPHAGTGRAAAPARDPVLRVRATPGPGVSAARGRASPRLGSTCAGGAGGGAAPAPPPRSVRHSCERSHPDLFAPPSLLDVHVSLYFGGGGRAAQSRVERLSPEWPRVPAMPPVPSAAFHGQIRQVIILPGFLNGVRTGRSEIRFRVCQPLP